MFKDFGRRLQRDLKKIVDARVLANNARTGGEITVRKLYDILENKSDNQFS
jgi:hypothetical protein